LERGGKSGAWNAKQHRVYALDGRGNRIRGGDGNFIFNAVPTTDWGKPETLEAWRAKWVGLCNAKFAEKGSRLPHRQSLLCVAGRRQLPTVHEGPAVRQMEAMGIRTEKRDLNRWIQVTNTLLRDTRKKIAALLAWLREAQSELAAASKGMTIDLKRVAHAVSYMQLQKTAEQAQPQSRNRDNELQ
jgi:hypothetical protein